MNFTTRRMLTVRSFDPKTLLGTPSHAPMGKGPDFLVECPSGHIVAIELTEHSPYLRQALSAWSPLKSSLPTTIPPNSDHWAIVPDSEQRGTVVSPSLRKCPGALRKT